MSQTTYHTCPLCEATCGLEVTTLDRTVVSIRGDTHDVFSQGYLCPKAYSLKELDADPDRLRQPLIRRPDGWQTATWDEAFAEIEHRLMPIIQKGGRQAVAAYIGNPNAHNLSNLLYGPVLLKALGSPNLFSASTLDQMPKQVSAGLMFGHGLNIPVPDLERTDFLLMLGANPLASNGSLMTAPDMRGRLRRLRQRGGRLVVIDPQRTRTAEEADEHYFITPGSDAAFLLALAHVLFDEDLVNPGRLAGLANGLDEIRALVRPFTPESVVMACGIPAAAIRRLARDLAAAPRAAVYGRIGTCVNQFGTLASWLVDVLNFLTGNLDREGGAMFTNAAVQPGMLTYEAGKGRGVKFGRWKSRVSGYPEVFGELPVNALAEEIETPGEGQVQALITVAGNPCLSMPNSARLQKALDSLEFMVSVDIYLNETTRHANVILPAPSALERSHYDVALYRLSVHNVANYSPPLFRRAPGQPDEWEILLRLAGLFAGQGPNPDVAALDDNHIRQLVEKEVEQAASSIFGRIPAEILAELSTRRGPERMLDFYLRSGPHGDGFGAKPGGVTLAKLEANPHGLDLGPLTPRLPEALRTPSGKIELAPSVLLADVERLQRWLSQVQPGQLVLIGRRDLRSNNSWMHNLPVLVKGKPRCTLRMHSADAAHLGLIDGEMVTIASRTGQVEAPLEITDNMMPGVVSLPHGWGHNLPGVQLRVAAASAGVNCNLLADEALLDPLSGNAVLNGIPVTVSKPASVA